MRLLNVVCVLAIFAGAARSEDIPAKVRVALALAQAVATSEPVTAGHCLTDKETALRRAVAERKAVVIWVGMRCEDSPALRDALGGAIHLHQDSWLGDSSRHLVVQPANGNKAYSWSEEQIRQPGRVAEIRAVACPDCPDRK